MKHILLLFGFLFFVAGSVWAGSVAEKLIVAGDPFVAVGRQVESDGGALVINNIGSGLVVCVCRRVGSVLQNPVHYFNLAPIFGSYRVDTVPDGEAWTTWCISGEGSVLSFSQAENTEGF